MIDNTDLSIYIDWTYLHLLEDLITQADKDKASEEIVKKYFDDNDEQDNNMS